MILSPRPWHLKFWPNGFTSLIDATGKTIAMFASYDDAEWLLNQSGAKHYRGVHEPTSFNTAAYAALQK